MTAVVIGYTSTAISVTEGDTATFSAEVMSGNLGDLAVRVVQSTLDGTATGISHQREFTGLFCVLSGALKVSSHALYITVHFSLFFFASTMHSIMLIL